jgi:putative lipoic acid-binding regulatory protein
MTRPPAGRKPRTRAGDAIGAARYAPAMPTADEERLLALLESTHTFPGPFFLSVSTRNDPDVVVALRAAIEAGLDTPGLDWETRESATAKYVSHRVSVPCTDADAVLALYARVRAVSGVVTIL